MRCLKKGGAGTFLQTMGKTDKKHLVGGKFVPNGPKLGQKLDFLPFSQVWFISYP